VVSTSPALVLEGDRIVSFSSVAEKGTHPPVALTGQVPCKVSLENGPIEPGDLLTTSSTPGYAMKATADIDHIGTIIGKALMPFNKTISENSDMGIINVFLSLQ
jgi:hypothetical protein